MKIVVSSHHIICMGKNSNRNNTCVNASKFLCDGKSLQNKKNLSIRTVKDITSPISSQFTTNEMVKPALYELRSQI